MMPLLVGLVPALCCSEAVPARSVLLLVAYSRWRRAEVRLQCQLPSFSTTPRLRVRRRPTAMLAPCRRCLAISTSTCVWDVLEFLAISAAARREVTQSPSRRADLYWISGVLQTAAFSFNCARRFSADPDALIAEQFQSSSHPDPPSKRQFTILRRYELQSGYLLIIWSFG